MKKLSKAHRERFEEIATSLAEAHEKLVNSIAKFNGAMMNQKESVSEALSGFNEAIGEAEEFRSEVENELLSYADERFETWQDTDRGQAFFEWLEQWGEELEVLDIEFPDDIEEPEDPCKEKFTEENYPHELRLTGWAKDTEGEDDGTDDHA